MENYARFKNLDRPPVSSSSSTEKITAPPADVSFPARPKGQNTLKTETWTNNKRKSLLVARRNNQPRRRQQKALGNLKAFNQNQNQNQYQEEEKAFVVDKERHGAS
jgi:hypothetical protein